VVNQIEFKENSFKIMNILKISIIVAIVGIISLFLISRLLTEETIEISELKIGQIERISGMITSVYISRDDHVFLKVADNTGEITVVAFKNSNIDEAYDLEVGEELSVLGRVDEYKGELEIIAKEIRKI
jgi:DNA/RNA endonuclease YhcR with UshA esterase domain